MEGKVKYFNDAKGFGFINGNDGEEYFVHITSVLNSEELVKDMDVTFDIVKTEKGKQAQNVKPV